MEEQPKKKRKYSNKFAPALSTPSTSRGTAEDDGSQPQDINVIAMAERRSREIRTLLVALKSKSTNKRLFQQLPRHMRRRAMSHNIKRLPKALRPHAERETSAAKKPHRPRKKYRKRARNKKLAFAKRQSVSKWLETHVWHAKRFHMIAKWGHKIPHFPNDKGYRAAFRASNEHCLMFDISYYTCFRLQGNEFEILNGLQSFVSKDTGRTFANKDCLAGSVEQSCILYKSGHYPNGAIGPARFLFEPKVEGKDERSLLMWIHPSVRQEIAEALESIFRTKVKTYLNHTDTAKAQPETQTTEVQMETGTTSETSRIAEVEIKESTVPMEAYRTEEMDTENQMEGAVSVTLMEGEFNRLRLIGPESLTVLKNVLKVASSDGLDTTDRWWMQYYSDATQKSAAVSQKEVWESLDGSTMRLRNGAVVPLTVRDPRIFLPKKKASKPVIPAPVSTPESEQPVRASLEMDVRSPMWNDEIRQRVETEKISTHELNKLRSELPAPGVQLDMGDNEARVPVVLVRNTGVWQQAELSKSEYAAGWDIILPRSWAMLFWVPFVYSGARVGALQEMSTLSLHSAVFRGEELPDTSAGAEEAVITRKELESKYQRYPPNKRPNYLKLGCASPFHAPWSALIRNWTHKTDGESDALDSAQQSTEDGFYVVRDLRVLSLLDSWILQKQKLSSLNTGQLSLLQHTNGIVPIFLSFPTGGGCEQFSTICLPEESDWKIEKGRPVLSSIVEPKHPDPFKKNEVKERRKLQVAKVLSDPEPGDLNASSRKIVGYVTKAGFNLVKGYETALGFCSVIGLLEHLKNTKGAVKVLTRSPHSFHYHSADIRVLLSSPSL